MHAIVRNQQSRYNCTKQTFKVRSIKWLRIVELENLNKRLKAAFIDLLHKYDFNDVTVQQITDLGDINRGTFYTHYLDKYDLLDKMEDEHVDIVRNFIKESKRVVVESSQQKT